MSASANWDVWTRLLNYLRCLAEQLELLDRSVIQLLIMDANLSPCKGKSFKNQGFIKLLLLQGALLIAIIPRALPWARSFWAFSPFLNHMRKFCCLNKSLYIFYWKVCTFGNLLLCEPHAEKTFCGGQLFFGNAFYSAFFSAFFLRSIDRIFYISLSLEAIFIFS